MNRALAGIAAAAALAGCHAPVDVGSPVVHAGPARFTVLSPRLVRLEYSESGVFEDRPTFFATRREPTAAFTTRLSGGWREIRTSSFLLRYREGSGRFTPENLRLFLSRRGALKHARVAWDGTPDPGHRAANLGGWRRDLGFVKGDIELLDGLLGRDGWYLIDDTATPLWDGGDAWPRPRPARPAASYSDQYLFAYGDAYSGALGDLARLTGPAPLLPRWAFGIWFSRYRAYGERDLRALVARFRRERIPLDVLVVDTDYKAPDAWNGWGWNPRLFPDPAAFLAWTEREGIHVTLNVHPSVRRGDPARARMGSARLLEARGQCPWWQKGNESCGAWDWADRAQLEAYFALHRPFERAGVDFWWLDWCCDGSRVSLDGIAPDAWINHRYARRLEATGRRGFVLSRAGGRATPAGRDESPGGIWVEHRSTVHFTGDTYPTWPLLGFAAEYTAREGNTGMPYVTHDLGSHLAGGPAAPDLAPDMYLRWIQLGTFQPIFRLHGLGRRLPWEFDDRVGAMASALFRLRGMLVPYLYTVAEEAHRTGLPMARAMYLDHPADPAAYEHPRQYMLGSELLIAPVATPGDPAIQRVWFPPGRWIDLFTGEVHRGPSVERLTVPLARAPAFARVGAILPLAAAGTAAAAAPDPLTIRVFCGGDGAFALYEDAGEGLGYRRGASARTRLTYREGAGARPAELAIEPASGRFPGQAARRRYRVELTGLAAPPSHVTIDRRPAPRRAGESEDGWWWDADAGTAVVAIPARSPGARTLVAHDGRARAIDRRGGSR